MSNDDKLLKLMTMRPARDIPGDVYTDHTGTATGVNRDKDDDRFADDNKSNDTLTTPKQDREGTEDEG
jgi:hypothetical protein